MMNSLTFGSSDQDADILHAGRQATALRAMLEAETQRSPDFLRLANALSALGSNFPAGERTQPVGNCQERP